MDRGGESVMEGVMSKEHKEIFHFGKEGEGEKRTAKKEERKQRKKGKAVKKKERNSKFATSAKWAKKSGE